MSGLGPATSPLTKIKSYQYPAEHVGHLGGGHAGALEKFKQLCQAKGYYTPQSPASDRPEPSHDDETLLRYLRARKWVPEDAFQQFAETEDWRKENKLDQLYETIDVEDYEQTRRLYPQWTGRRDRRGIPIYVFEVAHLNAKAIAAYESSTKKPSLSVSSKVPAKLMRLFALYENLVTFVFPLCSHVPDRQYPETPVSQSTNIVDISNVGLKQFWNLKRHMEDASQLATAHYPETLASIYVIGAPSFFPTVWGWIKRWFDPITVSKIYILNEKIMKSTFDEAIDPVNLPRKYGGQLDWNFGDLPNVDPAIQSAITWRSSTKSIPTGPIRWRAVGEEEVAYAVGTENGKPRNQEIIAVRGKTMRSQASLGVAEENLEVYRTQSGVYTHPPSPPPDANEPETPPSESDFPLSPESQQVAPNSGLETNRQGTTATRFEQQNFTHGSDQLASDTPNIARTADGDRQGVMDPHTVSQALKQHPLPIPDHEPQPSYVDQAMNLAESAYVEATHAATAAMKAMGLKAQDAAAETHDAEPKVPEITDEPVVDSAPAQKVEEFLRSKVVSTAKK